MKGLENDKALRTFVARSKKGVCLSCSWLFVLATTGKRRR